MGNSPANQHTDKRTGKRFYECPVCGGKHWSVTTLIGSGVPKPWLGPWQAKEVATFAVTDTTWREMGPADAIDYLKRTGNRKRDAAAGLGTAVHKAVEAHTLERPMPTWPLPVKPYMVEFASFLRRYQPVYEAAELQVHNCEHDYSGTLDAIATIDGRRLLIDYKSGPKHPYAEGAMQLTALARSPKGYAAGEVFDMPKIDGGAILRLYPGDTALIEMEVSDRVFDAFLHAQAMYAWGDTVSRQVIGAEILPPDAATGVLAAQALSEFGGKAA